MLTIPDITFEYLIGAVLIGGSPNTYFGSVSLKEASGVFDDAFRYRLTVNIPKDKDGNVIGEKTVSASHWVSWQAYDVVDKNTVTEQSFSPDEEGAAAAIKWLKDELEKIKSL